MHHATPSASAFAIAAFGLIVGLLPAPASAQIDISGYIQAEWQHFDLAEDQNDRGIYSDERKNLFLIRRGRLKASHTSDEGIQGVIQIDATERGMAIKDAYLTVPLLDSSLLDVTVGLFNKPNYEVELSSRKRESPERSQVRTPPRGSSSAPWERAMRRPSPPRHRATPRTSGSSRVARKRATSSITSARVACRQSASRA